jgi:hypothetical protein
LSLAFLRGVIDFLACAYEGPILNIAGAQINVASNIADRSSCLKSFFRLVVLSFLFIMTWSDDLRWRADALHCF